MRYIIDFTSKELFELHRTIVHDWKPNRGLRIIDYIRTIDCIRDQFPTVEVDLTADTPNYVWTVSFTTEDEFIEFKLKYL
jgi:hypothetical protein